MLKPTPRERRWPALTPEQILTWVDTHHERTGEWPTEDSGVVLDAPREKWRNIDAALRKGLRGLGPGSSLPRLLAEHRGLRNRKALAPLSEAEILAWADGHYQRTGQWPNSDSGAIEGAPGETWAAVRAALSQGIRGLPGGSSLAQLLARHRQVRNIQDLPPLSEEQILAWADSHYERTGDWPHVNSGTIPEAPSDNWAGVSAALRLGRRELTAGSSLGQLLAQRRGVRNEKGLPALTEAQILTWADAHHERTGRWPSRKSGPVSEAPGETWMAVQMALSHGHRGLPGGASLARLLARHRGVRNRMELPALTEDQILAWADAHHERTGAWPSAARGPVVAAPGELWSAADQALKQGNRGLPGGSSLARLLAAQRGVRNLQALAPLTVDRILAWADAHHERTGLWPTSSSGPVPDAPGERWSAVNTCLMQGNRGLAPGSSLPRLLAQYRGVRNRKSLPALSIPQILAWAEVYHSRRGEWPRRTSGPIDDAPGETWAAVEAALQNGNRGLPGGSSLHKLIRQCRKE